MGAAWRALVAARRALAEAEAGAADEQGRLDELRALADAVAEVDPQPGEEDELGRERSRLRHLDVLREAAQEAAELLNPEEGAGAVALSGEAAHALDRVREHDAALAGPGDELTRIADELREASVELRSYLDGLDADPAVLDRIEERLEQLAELRRRFGGVDEAADLRPRAAAAAAELAEGERADERIARSAAAVAAAEKTAGRLAAALQQGAPEGRQAVRGRRRAPSRRHGHGRRPPGRRHHGGAARRARDATRWSCAWRRTPACPQGRSGASPRAASCRASRSRCASRRATEARPRCSSSTRSTPASAVGRRAC